ncbi:hypothetical protein Pcinc_018911 [Petrolisthes cinctipes]|uniref:Uncharacterized protein n=1 Tax=Petrolisthes cinctipes TaxID=88211 RepID=A0AAE1FL72_PETCI|nr:hypothetical protein Pcinc_018911 [Petrolisthes cinctipes]
MTRFYALDYWAFDAHTPHPVLPTTTITTQIQTHTADDHISTPTTTIQPSLHSLSYLHHHYHSDPNTHCRRPHLNPYYYYYYTALTPVPVLPPQPLSPQTHTADDHISTPTTTTTTIQPHSTPCPTTTTQIQTHCRPSHLNPYYYYYYYTAHTPLPVLPPPPLPLRSKHTLQTTTSQPLLLLLLIQPSLHSLSYHSHHYQHSTQSPTTHYRPSHLNPYYYYYYYYYYTALTPVPVLLPPPPPLPRPQPATQPQQALTPYFCVNL